MTQVVVAARQDRRPQRGDERDGVGTVRDGPQDREQVADLLRLVDERAGLGAELHVPWRAARPSASSSEVRVGTRIVMSSGRAGRQPVAVVHRPPVAASARMPATASATVVGLQLPQRTGRELSSLACGPPSRRTRWPAGPSGRCAASGSYRGCSPGTLLGHQRAEDVVDPVDDRRHGPEVGGQPHRPAGEAIAGVEEQPDVGPPESVDRLLRVTHEEQARSVDLDVRPRRPASRPPSTEAAMSIASSIWIGSVSWNSSMSSREYRSCSARPGLGAVAQQRPGEHQQVVELEPALPPTLVGGGEGEPGDLARQDAQHRVGSGLA